MSTTNLKLDKMLVVPIEMVGARFLASISSIGVFIFFFKESLLELVKKPIRFSEIIRQMEFIGNQSLVIIIMSAFSIGSVFGLQVGMVFKTFSAEGQMGIATATALTRELAPMMTAFLITGRAGSAITAEIATMKVNEQVEAMESMGVSPIHYLVVPRLIAAFFMTPLLSGVFVFVGVLGSFLVGTLVFNVDEGLYFYKITDQLVHKDILMGLEKSVLFSVVIALIACQFGLSASGGAKGVGQATTNSVITMLLMILLLDFAYTFFQIAV